MENIEKLSYEQARDALVAIVKNLESGTATLEESITLWERAEALAAHCGAWLASAHKRLDDATAKNSAATEGETQN